MHFVRLIVGSGQDKPCFMTVTTGFCPLILEMDWCPPRDVAERLRHLPGLVWLDSAMAHPTLGRYSYIAVDPVMWFRVQPGDDPAPLSRLRALLQQWHMPHRDDVPPFQGGAIGMIGYEFACWLEHVPRPADSTGDDLCFGFYDVILAFDHVQQRCWLMSNGMPETGTAARIMRAEIRLRFFQDLLSASVTMFPPPDLPAPCWHTNFDQVQFMSAVDHIKNYILAGDIYQANMARKMIAAWSETIDPWYGWLALRTSNPAPFAAWLDLPDRKIASTSPERFLFLKDGIVETRPIKGTIRRDHDPIVDQQRADALLQSEKDRAENIMIVDLLRNDLSRVCTPRSVDVPVLCGIESYAGLHHLVSVVTGQLAEGHDGLDLLTACFPGGSITGAPKIRAMEIIAEHEKTARGCYCGSIGWIGLDGSMDLNIAIRTVVFQNNQVHFHSGGGITMLSDPQDEYAEIMTKSDRIMRAFCQGDTP